MKRLQLAFVAVALGAAATLMPAEVRAGIPSISDGTAGVADFDLKATDGLIDTPDGNEIFFWGYRDESAASPLVQYPGPTLVVTEGDVVTVTLTSDLPAQTSIVFPGQSGVTATDISGGSPVGLLADFDVVAGKTVSYSFTAGAPGTYTYHSGTDMDVQLPMGLFGALIVRPGGYSLTPAANKRAYSHADAQYDREYLMLHSEMDPRINRQVQINVGAGDPPYRYVDTTTYFPVYWFLNGRPAPDTFWAPGVEWLPQQPYSALFQMHPGEKVLMRVIGGTRDAHPFHAHGNFQLNIARDGRLLSTGPGNGADLAFPTFTIMATPGKTVDAIYEWTGEGLGWDIYGHDAADALEPAESAADHGKPIPVLQPEGLDMAFGGLWSGSPFLGQLGALPPGEGGNNEFGAFTMLWHSHAEKEIVNNDIFPGGLIGVMFIEHPDTDLTGTGDGLQ